MIIDFHTHVFPEEMAEKTISFLEDEAGMKAATRGTLQELIQSMDEAGVDVSVIVPVVTSPKQFRGINRFAHEINETYGEIKREGLPRIVSFGGMHPESGDYRGELNELKSMGFQGIKFHPDYQKICFNDIRYKRIVEYATELGMNILVHAGVDIGLPDPVHCTPKMSAEVIKDTESDQLILAHLGGWKQWNQVEELLVGTGVYLDISFIQNYIPMEQFYRIVKNHGEDRILFATDSPWSNQAEAVNWLRASELSEETKEKIFWKNGVQLLRNE